MAHMDDRPVKPALGASDVFSLPITTKAKMKPPTLCRCPRPPGPTNPLLRTASIQTFDTIILVTQFYSRLCTLPALTPTPRSPSTPLGREVLKHHGYRPVSGS